MTYRFTAPTPAEALGQIHAQLGPEAVIFSVRRLPAQGLARLLPTGKHSVEVLAGIPEPTCDSAVARIPAQFPSHPPHPDSHAGWQTVAWLEMMGLLPEHAAQLQTRLDAQTNSKPASLDEEWSAVSAQLGNLWPVVPRLREPNAAGRPHVFIGPPGSGKTTVLCKWLTLAVLTEARPARVWRLDGNTANTAEFLGIHCEMLDTPIDRFWSSDSVPSASADLHFIDLPGVEARDTHGLNAMRKQLASFPSPRIHLVLNAAYDTAALLQQWRAFSPLQPEDLIFTHLDEEVRRVKLWNFVFEDTAPMRFLSAGHKIPGDFLPATPALLFPSSL